jgi:fructose-1,6-bisphosphatase/inositol monophosphatase family enzyme
MRGLTAAQLQDLWLLMREAAEAEILPRFRHLGAGTVRMKTGPLDLVTDADEAAERLITARLLALFPGCVVVGEEAASRDPGVLAALGTADLCFVVDPVDGTSNFAAGLTLFGVMAAAVRRGEVVAGLILDPVGDDIAIALRGEGAWIERPDGHRRDLRVAAPVAPAAMTGAASWRNFAPDLRDTILGNLRHVAASWDYRCAAHEYRMLADGHCHYTLFNRLMPWDHAPGWLLHREAGGYSACLDGTAYVPSRSEGGMLCAPDEASWQALRETLLAGYAGG